MTDTVYLLQGEYRDRDCCPRTIRAFDSEHPARKWAYLLECAASDAHFPVTYAELQQDFEWIPKSDYHEYSVVEHEVHSSGWDE